MTSATALLGETTSVSRRAARQARRLTKDRTRRKLADAIERAVAAAEAPAGAISAAIPVQRAAVAACRPDLLELAARLRTPGPAYAHGVAVVSGLLRDAESPLYQSDSDLSAAVRGALAALDGHVK
jgi:transposase InsO family protein